MSNPYNVYGRDVAVWFVSEINKMKEEINDCCIDNIRFAQVGKKGQMRRYKRKRKSGCCGFENRIVKHEVFETFKIGCNYGH